MKAKKSFWEPRGCSPGSKALQLNSRFTCNTALSATYLPCLLVEGGSSTQDKPPRPCSSTPSSSKVSSKGLSMACSCSKAVGNASSMSEGQAAPSLTCSGECKHTFPRCSWSVLCFVGLQCSECHARTKRKMWRTIPQSLVSRLAG